MSVPLELSYCVNPLAERFDLWNPSKGSECLRAELLELRRHGHRSPREGDCVGLRGLGQSPGVHAVEEHLRSPGEKKKNSPRKVCARPKRYAGAPRLARAARRSKARNLSDLGPGCRGLASPPPWAPGSWRPPRSRRRSSGRRPMQHQRPSRRMRPPRTRLAPARSHVCPHARVLLLCGYAARVPVRPCIHRLVMCVRCSCMSSVFCWASPGHATTVCHLPGSTTTACVTLRARDSWSRSGSCSKDEAGEYAT